MMWSAVSGENASSTISRNSVNMIPFLDISFRLWRTANGGKPGFPMLLAERWQSRHTPQDPMVGAAHAPHSCTHCISERRQISFNLKTAVEAGGRELCVSKCR